VSGLREVADTTTAVRVAGEKSDKGTFHGTALRRGSKLDALKWRCIGPPRGGRVVAVAGDPKDRGVFYFGACAGGVWKTIDGGIYWRCVSDGFFGSAAIGALAVASSDPNVIYAGTGETEIRLDVSYGLGAAIAVGAGVIATILTGEYLASWVYLLADIGSGAIGVAVALLAVRFVSLRRFIRRRQ
jgi:hypothetical protein